jgi:hypothetical protein
MNEYKSKAKQTKTLQTKNWQSRVVRPVMERGLVYCYDRNHKLMASNPNNKLAVRTDKSIPRPKSCLIVSWQPTGANKSGSGLWNFETPTIKERTHQSINQRNPRRKRSTQQARIP